MKSLNDMNLDLIIISTKICIKNEVRHYRKYLNHMLVMYTYVCMKLLKFQCYYFT
jgi:hypothetical protein